MLAEAQDEIGVDLRQFPRFVLFGDFVSDDFFGVVVNGSFDQDALLLGIEEAAEVQFTTSDYKGHTVYSFGEKDDEAMALEERTLALDKQLMCPVCPGETIYESQTTLAKQMRAIVRERLAAGRSDQDVFDYYVSVYGASVLSQQASQEELALIFLDDETGVLGNPEATRQVVDLLEGDRKPLGGSLMENFKSLGNPWLKTSFTLHGETFAELQEVPPNVLVIPDLFTDIQVVGLAMDKDGKSLEAKSMVEFAIS